MANTNHCNLVHSGVYDQGGTVKADSEKIWAPQKTQRGPQEQAQTYCYASGSAGLDSQTAANHNANSMTMNNQAIPEPPDTLFRVLFGREYQGSGQPGKTRAGTFNHEQAHNHIANCGAYRYNAGG